MKKERSELVDFDRFGKNLEERKNKFMEGGANMFDEEYFLKGKSEWIKDAYRKVSDICLNVKPGITKTYLQTYTRYNTPNQRMFCKVYVYQDSVKVYLRIDYKKLVDMPNWVRDYSQAANQTWTELWLVESNFQFNETITWDIIKGLIGQSFQKVSKAKSWKNFPLAETEKTMPEFVSAAKSKISLEVGSDGFVDLKLRCHKSELTSILNKILE